MSATITVTAIRVVTNTDHLFEGSDYDAALCNEEATREAYVSELTTELEKAYPGASVDVREDSVYRTTVSVDTTQDNSRDEETRFEVLTLTEAVTAAVDDCGVAVFSRGTFWQEA